MNIETSSALKTVSRHVIAPTIVRCIGAAGDAYARAQLDVLCGTGGTDARFARRGR
jgi:hypothetical protein